jgi:hypothetical protein
MCVPARASRTDNEVRKRYAIAACRQPPADRNQPDCLLSVRHPARAWSLPIHGQWRPCPQDLYAGTWSRSDSTHLLIFWSASGTTLQFPAITSAVLHDPLNGSRIELSGDSGVSLALKPSLQILEWKP